MRAQPPADARPLVTTAAADGVVTILMDDGRVNALSPTMIASLMDAFDEAQRHALPVVLTGRAGVFCGGFDLGVFQAGDTAVLRQMLRGGFHLFHRILNHPHPVIGACTGHAVAAGLFLLNSTDFRLTIEGDFRLVANEVAIGMTIPRPAASLLAARMNPAALQRAILLAEPFDPRGALAAGLVDAVVKPDELLSMAYTAAATAVGLDPTAHAASKALIREPLLEQILAGTDVDFP